MIRAKSESEVLSYIIEQFANNEILLTGTYNNNFNFTFESISGLDRIHLRSVLPLISFRTEVEDRLTFELHYNYSTDSLRCNVVTKRINSHNGQLMPCSDEALTVLDVTKLRTEESHFQQMTRHDVSKVHHDDINILLNLVQQCRDIANAIKC